jgi:hypothetical protein
MYSGCRTARAGTADDTATKVATTQNRLVPLRMETVLDLLPRTTNRTRVDSRVASKNHVGDGRFAREFPAHEALLGDR